MKLKLIPVTSSAIQAVGYDPATQELHVQFRSSGQTYTYPGVTPKKHAAFMAAKSMGKHFMVHIRSPKAAAVE